MIIALFFGLWIFIYLSQIRKICPLVFDGLLVLMIAMDLGWNADHTVKNVDTYHNSVRTAIISDQRGACAPLNGPLSLSIDNSDNFVITTNAFATSAKPMAYVNHHYGFSGNINNINVHFTLSTSLRTLQDNGASSLTLVVPMNGETCTIHENIYLKSAVPQESLGNKLSAFSRKWG